MDFKTFSLIIIILISFLFSVKCEESENITSTDNSFDNSFNVNDFDENNKVGLDLNLNQNCTTNEDCTAKHSVCDQTFNTCECDMTSMQMQFKCRSVFCQMREECSMRFAESTCIMGRCQCISGNKLNGKCIRGKGIGYGSGPLPDWAIISIAVTLALTVIGGGSLKKVEVRQYLMRIIRMFLQKEAQSLENSTSSEETDRNVNNKDKDIELSTI